MKILCLVYIIEEDCTYVCVGFFGASFMFCRVILPLN